MEKSHLKNPWCNVDFNSEKIVFEIDRSFLPDNSFLSYENEYHYDLLPEPFQGNTSAEIVILGLNPGYSHKDKDFHLSNNKFKESLIKCITEQDQEYPFYSLNPNYKKSEAWIYWSSRKKGKLKNLLSKFNSKFLANNLLSIEYYPYKSIQFKKNKYILPSQEYSFYLVKKAIDRNALILILRSVRYWLEAVPELNNHNYLELKNQRNMIISEGNVVNNRFNEIIERLNKIKSSDIKKQL